MFCATTNMSYMHNDLRTVVKYYVNVMTKLKGILDIGLPVTYNQNA